MNAEPYRFRNRDLAASLKTNMHVFQVATEDYDVRNSAYPTDASQAAALLTQGGSVFYNPFTKQPGNLQARADQPTWTRPLASGMTLAGLVAYGDSAGTRYQIVGRGSSSDLPLILFLAIRFKAPGLPVDTVSRRIVVLR